MFRRNWWRRLSCLIESPDRHKDTSPLAGGMIRASRGETAASRVFTEVSPEAHTSCFICEDENRHHNCQCHYHLRTIRAALRLRKATARPLKTLHFDYFVGKFLIFSPCLLSLFCTMTQRKLRYVSVKLIVKLRCFQLSFISETKTTLTNTFLSLCCAGLPLMLTSAYLFTLLTFALEMKGS